MLTVMFLKWMKSLFLSLIGSCPNSWQLCCSDVVSALTLTWRCIQAGWGCTSSWPCPSRSTDPGKGCTPCTCRRNDCSRPEAIAALPWLYQHTGVPGKIRNNINTVSNKCSQSYQPYLWNNAGFVQTEAKL